jgi:Replication factor RFC1 C terminal domain
MGLDALTCCAFHGCTRFVYVWTGSWLGRIWLRPCLPFVSISAHPRREPYSRFFGPCSWLGNNSKQGKLQRQLNDVQIRMRLKVSGDRNEIRQSYVPAVFSHIVTPLIGKGVACILPHLVIYAC